MRPILLLAFTQVVIETIHNLSVTHAACRVTKLKN